MSAKAAASTSLDPATNGPTTSASELGARLRDLRQRRGFSLADLAARTETSRSLISQIERGQASPSMETVRRLASALEVPVFSLFLSGLNSETIVRAGSRRVVMYPGSNVRREILSPGTQGRMVLLWVTFPPGEHSGLQPVHHTGEECLVVVRGSLELHVGEDVITLETGDSATFDSELPHIFINPTDDITELVVAISPPRI